MDPGIIDYYSPPAPSPNPPPLAAQLNELERRSRSVTVNLAQFSQRFGPRREGQDTTEVAIRAIDENYANI